MNDDRVQDSFAAVPEEYYTHREDGSLITQSTSAQGIGEMLARLDVRPGMRVLEIGTGSGFSGALLGALVGERGSVVSIDVMADLVERAQKLHTARGADNITVITRDGAEGAPEHAPYDRIVAWASSEMLHSTWADQCVPGAVLVVPITLIDLPRSNAIVRAHRTRNGELAADRLWSGGYVEMHPEVLDQWLVPPRGVDARSTDAQGHPWWISAVWSRNGDGVRAAEALLAELAAGAEEREGPLGEGESVGDFHAYLYAARPEGLSMLGLGARGWAPGHSSARGAAALLGDGSLVHSADTGSVEQVHRWADQWRLTRSPGAASLRPVLEEVRGGMLVRAHAAVPA
ncbi:protein-L-isoaspartate O-methyltransferase [Nocardiopsis sp. JB363]|uniref:protein-L-isoaspartate O-methyltransferase family protein n=1 Tax=Nocardiopsis sp. JB363 TaxID=1434837 RepID=UPI00097A5F7E|nr:methyltransferase domain-containing protein [Nocardiopsis sp. JB363]SIO85552.1 Protein-L-isoaspartate O-methyltransferase [Nocardiopsis sp. JB363]